MRALVTGAGGFIGGHLAQALADRGDTVSAWTRKPGQHWSGNVMEAQIDITAPDAVRDAVHAFAPDILVHLAGKDLPGPSWQEAAETYRVNVLGTIHLLEAARTLPKPPRLLIAGSSSEYAEPTTGGLLAENALREPNSPYAASKVAVDDVAQLYGRRYGLDIIRFRPFLLIGYPKTGDMCSDFARRVVAIEKGVDTVMRVGDLRPVRDMLDVRDGVTALTTLCDAGVPGEAYNICSGRGTSVGDVMDAYRKLSKVAVTVEQDPALLRPLEQHSKIGDPGKLMAMGWAQKHEIADTLAGILGYWRTQEA